jgi:Uma2 family endonuclease
MSTAMHEWPRRHRITVDHYYRMAEAGLFEPDERVELIDGEIIDMPPMGTRHASTIDRLVDLLKEAVRDRAMVRSQLPVRLGDESEPQPDIAVVRSRDDYYATQHPTAADILLLVEISAATLRYDREIKVPLYALHGVREVWIIDLDSRQVHSHRAPADGRYTIVASSDLVAFGIDALAGVSVDLADLRARI